MKFNPIYFLLLSIFAFLLLITISSLSTNTLFPERLLGLAPITTSSFSSPTSTALGNDEVQPAYVRTIRPMPECIRQQENNNNIAPAKTFLMIFISRSGSTAISSTMESHPQIEHGYEYLEKKAKVPPLPAKNAIDAARVFFDEGIKKGKIPGFKIRAHYIMADPPQWAKFIQEYNTRIIWQYRKNIIKSTLGIYVRRVWNDSTATSGVDKRLIDQVNGDRCKLGIGCKYEIKDWDLFHQLMTNRVRQETDMIKTINMTNSNCVFELPYEDYLYHTKDTMTDLYKFLGVSTKYLNLAATSRVKATDDRICKVVANFDQMCNLFYGCRIWSHFVEDDGGRGVCRCSNYVHSSGKYCSIRSQEQIDKEQDLLSRIPEDSSQAQNEDT